MAEDGYTQAEIERCLVELKNKTGAWRSDLVELLQGPLRPLAVVLDVDTTRDRSTVRETLSSSLAGRIIQIESVRTRPARKSILSVVFNLQDHPELPAMNYTKRLEWLANNKRGTRAVPVITSRRLVDAAVPELAALLVRGYAQTQQNMSSPADVPANVEADSAGEGGDRPRQR